MLHHLRVSLSFLELKSSVMRTLFGQCVVSTDRDDDDINIKVVNYIQVLCGMKQLRALWGSSLIYST